MVPSVTNLRFEDKSPYTVIAHWDLFGDSPEFEQVEYYIIKWWRLGAKRKMIIRKTQGEINLVRF